MSDYDKLTQYLVPIYVAGPESQQGQSHLRLMALSLSGIVFLFVVGVIVQDAVTPVYLLI